MQEADEIADNLELAYQRYYACRGMPREVDVWDGYDRDCFIVLMTKRLERRDALAACVREAVHAFSLCGEATPCGSLPCVSGTLLDDNPVAELFTEDCSGSLDGEARRELRACR